MNCAPSQFPIGGIAREGWSEALVLYRCFPAPKAVTGRLNKRATERARKTCKPQDPVKLRGRRYSPDGRRSGQM